jgi:hypothetical protein
VKGRILAVLPYACARVPLGVVDITLVRRLPADSGMRAGFDCALGAFDVWAGQMLRNPRIFEHGCERVETVGHQAGLRVNGVGPKARSTAPRKVYAVTRARPHT